MPKPLTIGQTRLVETIQQYTTLPRPLEKHAGFDFAWPDYRVGVDVLKHEDGPPRSVAERRRRSEFHQQRADKAREAAALGWAFNTFRQVDVDRLAVPWITTAIANRTGRGWQDYIRPEFVNRFNPELC